MTEVPNDDLQEQVRTMAKESPEAGVDGVADGGAADGVADGGAADGVADGGAADGVAGGGAADGVADGGADNGADGGAADAGAEDLSSMSAVADPDFGEAPRADEIERGL